MKNKLKIATLIGGIMIISGLILSIAGKNMGSEKYISGSSCFECSKQINDYSYIYKQDKSEINTEISKITINAKTSDINILKSDNEKIYVEYKIGSEKEKNPIEYELADKNLRIKETNIGRRENREIKKVSLLNIVKIINFNREVINKGYINIYIPEYDKTEIELKNSVGNITINDIHTGLIEISQKVGDVNLDFVKFKKAKISSVSGNINIKNSDLINTSISMNTGDIIAYNTILKNSDLININGDIKVKRAEISENANISVTNGDIEVNLYNPQVNLNIKSINGIINYKSNKAVKYYNINNNSENVLNIKSTNGNIVVN